MLSKVVYLDYWAGPDADRPSSSCSKFEGSVGSFVDEGLDLSQRLAESMFLGPDLDSSAREVATSAGTRLMQTVERLLEALHATMQQVSYARELSILVLNSKLIFAMQYWDNILYCVREKGSISVSA